MKRSLQEAEIQSGSDPLLAAEARQAARYPGESGRRQNSTAAIDYHGALPSDPTHGEGRTLGGGESTTSRDRAGVP